jgi:hypothetical protein
MVPRAGPPCLHCQGLRITRSDRFNTGGLLETFQPNLQRVSVYKKNSCSTWLRIDCLHTRAKHDRPIASLPLSGSHA